MMRKVFFILIVLALAGVFVANYIRSWDFLLDDTYISMRYAKNFLEGKGLVYNVGERVEGYTNFFWVLLMSLFFLSGNFYLTLKISCLLCALLSLWLTYLIAQKQNGKKLVSLGAILLPAGNFYYAYHAAEGLETMFFLLMILLAIYLFIKEEDRPESFPYSVIPLILTYLTRPDGLTILAIFALGKFYYIFTAKKIRRYDLLWAGLIIFSVAIHLSWRLSYYGQLWPNTYYAKKMGFSLVDKGWGMINVLHKHIGLFWLLLIALFSFFTKKNRHWAIFFWLIIISRLLFMLFSGDIWVGIGGRFFIAAFPLLAILFFVGVYNLGEFAGQYFPQQRKLVSSILIILLVIGVNNNMSYPYKQSIFTLNNYGTGLERAHIALGKWLKEEAKPSDVIAVQDAGAIAFFSELKTIDQLGLNDKLIAHLPGDFNKRRIAKYIFFKAPTYIVLLSSNKYKLMHISRADIDIATSPLFRPNYEFIKKYSFVENYYLFVYRKKT